MHYLVALPEVAYVKSGGDVIGRWFPPKGMWFKFQALEFDAGVGLEEMKAKLLVSDAPVYLTKEEVSFYKKKYGTG
jgi:hypothetical protein